ncbi:hypothetical protein ACFYO0_15550 [Streptomyces sp. NPDC006365]|uniref:hypothetical protein n=1 Tax=Streptomyces sp. NPDC006365 TaxID=3364744 RepID=UPI0036971D24
MRLLIVTRGKHRPWGAMDAHPSDGLFWSALLGGSTVAVLVTTPVNKRTIGRGKGHAVVHAHH